MLNHAVGKITSVTLTLSSKIFTAGVLNKISKQTNKPNVTPKSVVKIALLSPGTKRYSSNKLIFRYLKRRAFTLHLIYFRLLLELGTSELPLRSYRKPPRNSDKFPSCFSRFPSPKDRRRRTFCFSWPHTINSPDPKEKRKQQKLGNK